MRVKRKRNISYSPSGTWRGHRIYESSADQLRRQLASERKQQRAYERAEKKREKAERSNPKRKRRDTGPESRGWLEQYRAMRGPSAKARSLRQAHYKRMGLSPMGNPALKPVRKSTGWLNGPAGTNTQIKFKKNPGGRTEVYIRRKARTNSARLAAAERRD